MPFCKGERLSDNTLMQVDCENYYVLLKYFQTNNKNKKESRKEERIAQHQGFTWFNKAYAKQEFTKSNEVFIYSRNTNSKSPLMWANWLLGKSNQTFCGNAYYSIYNTLINVFCRTKTSFFSE